MPISGLPKSRFDHLPCLCCGGIEVAVLVNFEQFEAIPAACVRGRGASVSRALALGRWLLRRKSDGRYLAVMQPGGSLRLLLPQAFARVRGRLGMQALQARLREAGRRSRAALLPLDAVRGMLDRLGVDATYGRTRQLALVPEPAWLAFAGWDRYRRALWLTPAAARAWQRMQAAAAQEGVALDAISGYRSHAYQLGIFQRKLARDMSLDEILAVNAAPGYSEHHSGRALDIGTPGQAPAEEDFESTPAFDWLCRRAARFGFALSYPRNNPHGIVYEPWHWRFSA